MSAVGRHLSAVRTALADDKERVKTARQHQETEFLQAALEIIERPVSPTARVTSWILITGLVLTILWLTFGRIDVVEDRLVGIKSREIYEAPGAMALITAHKHLEDITVEREQARFKATVGQRWSELVYDGQWFSPLKRSLDAFIDDTQKYVSGDIRMVLHGGQAIVNGRRSETSLYDFDLATYDTGDTFDQSMARGFIELWGMSAKVASGRDIRVAGK